MFYEITYKKSSRDDEHTETVEYPDSAVMLNSFYGKHPDWKIIRFRGIDAPSFKQDRKTSEANR